MTAWTRTAEQLPGQLPSYDQKGTEHRVITQCKDTNVQAVEVDASETVDQSAARIGQGTIKAVCFGSLRSAGADGLDILALVQAVQVRNLTKSV